MENNNKETKRTFAILYIILIISMISFYNVKAQNSYGCTDSVAINYYSNATVDDGGCVYLEASGNYAEGWSTSAIVSIKSPTANIFEFNKLVLKYKKAGSSNWIRLVFPITPVSSGSEHLDTNDLSCWFYESTKVNGNGNEVGDGYRFNIYVRLKGLDMDQKYKTVAFLKGDNHYNGDSTTERLKNSFKTNGVSEAPYPTVFNFINNSTVNAKLKPVSESDRVLLSTYNIQGQLVNANTKGIVINVYSDGTNEKVLR
tara:strand:- start:867 stop:1637 length:771 start_codon:yes stop_codon:yes gene_type:complete